MIGEAAEVIQEQICDDQLILIKGWVNYAFNFVTLSMYAYSEVQLFDNNFKNIE